MSEYFGTDPLARIAFLEAENAKLRDRVRKLEDQLRWRKWPDEKPNTDGDYYVCWDDECAIGIFDIKIGWLTGEPFHWRPIGPLPGGE
jgi:hypothetical protein